MNYVWLRGASARPRYVGLGDSPNRMYPLLSYLTGARESAERAVMRLPVRLLAGAEPWPGAAGAVESALADQREPRSGLLLYTGYYKETTFVGPVVPGEDPDQVVFWKAFPGQHDVDQELSRASQMSAITPAGVTTAPCRQAGMHIVEYERMPRTGRALSRRDHVACAVGIARSSLVLGPRDQPAVPLEPTVVRAFVEMVDYSDVPLETLVGELERCARLPLFLSHGDLTRWNVFPTRDRRVAVVDYDAVGFRPAYFDLVHGVAQEFAERDEVPPLETLRSALTGASHSTPGVDLAACLFWDAYETMRQHLAHPENRAGTEAVVRLKLTTWRASRG